MANIPNPSFDIVLGKPWLAAKNPCVDWINNVVRLNHAGSTHTLTPPPPTPLQADQLNLLSAPRFRRAARHDEVFMALLTQQPNPPSSPSSSTPAPNPPPLHPKAAALVQQYPSVFPKELPAVQDMPRRSVDHTIHFTGPAPSPRPIYRMSQPELDQLKKQLDDLLAKGFIRPSTSPFAAPVLFVRKKDGSLRLCVDFRALNQQTLKNRAQVFSKIDLRSGYHQIRVAEDDIPKTAFRTRYGHYEFTVLPFGLCNAPATFQQLMNDVFNPHLDDFVLVYLDDILVFSKSAADHERHLHLTLSLLRQHQLCANLAKCAFWLDTVDTVDHIVSAAGIQPDPTKVKTVLDWPAPQDKHQLRSFLGTANYYRRLLHHHAHRVLPLTDLLRDEQPWRWGEAEQRAFADIKAAMASSPVVRPPDFSLPFTVKTDASLFAIGAVLTQQDSSGAEYVVAYESRKLNPAQVNYPAHERELLAVLHALTTWRHYLLGRPFIVETDNSATTHVLTQSNLTGRQMRWTQRLAEFDITFVHKAGKHHTVPDALSRRPDHQLTALSIVDPNPSFFSTFDRHAPEDPAYQAALSQVLSPPSPCSPTHLQVIEGRLYTTSNPPRLYIPSSPLRAQLLHEAHDAHTAAHLGRAKTLERLQRHFYWPQMHKTVQEYVRTCDKCQRNKATNQLPPGLLQPLPIPSRNWQQVSMDFIGPFPATPRGHTMIFTIVDKLSKMIHLIPTTTTATAQDTARLFFDHIFKHHGLPEAIVSDRDPKFTFDFWTSLFHLTGTRLLLSSAYHPQTDGQTERANRTVEDMLRPYVNDHKSDWDQHLAAVEFAYNSSEHVGTGFTPFYLNYGQHPTTPSALLLPPPTLVPSQAAEDFVTSMRNNLTAARSALQRSIDTQKLHADQHRRHEEFEVGVRVLLSCANLNLQSAVNSAKLQPRFVGPFKVLAKHSPVPYKLDLPSSMRILPTFHISRLRPYLSSSSFPERAVELQPSPVIIDGEAYFTVEAILGRRWNDAQHAFQYLIKWAGYDDSFNSWEWGPALAQQDAVAALIRDYTARHHAPVDDDTACQVCASRSPRPPMLLSTGEMHWWPEAFPCRAAYAAVGLATRDYFPGKHGVLGRFEDQHQTHTSPRVSQAAVQQGNQPLTTVSKSALVFLIVSGANEVIVIVSGVGNVVPYSNPEATPKSTITSQSVADLQAVLNPAGTSANHSRPGTGPLDDELLNDEEEAEDEDAQPDEDEDEEEEDETEQLREELAATRSELTSLRIRQRNMDRALNSLAAQEQQLQASVHAAAAAGCSAGAAAAGCSAGAAAAGWRTCAAVHMCMDESLLVNLFVTGLSPSLRETVLKDIVPLQNPTLTQAMDSARQAQRNAVFLAGAVSSKRHVAAVQGRAITEQAEHEITDANRPLPLSGRQPIAPRPAGRTAPRRGGMRPGPPPAAAGKKAGAAAAAATAVKPGQYCHHCYSPDHLKPQCPWKHLPAKQAREQSGYSRPPPGANVPQKRSRPDDDDKGQGKGKLAQITDLLAKGLIEPSSSPFAAPVLFVQKKSGELRMCIDYRQLNKITIRDQYPLPRIDDLFDQLAGKTVFSSLDLQAGYHQIRIPAEDVPKTAFRTPEGHYQFKSFLGAANYVRKFVHNFSTIAAPLTNLTGPKKDSFPWKSWPQAELDAFNALKQAIANVPMLKLPDHSKPFQVHCDASLEGIGAVLMQDGYPLAYYSRKLIPAEVNYTTGEQELLALWLVRAYAADSNFTKRRKTKNYYLDDNGLWRHNKRRTVIVPRDKQLREHILHEMHDAKKSSDSVFQVGDRVLLSTMNLRNMVGKARKLLPRYVGPFRIEAHVGEDAVKLTLPSAMSRIHPVFHVSLLRPYEGNFGRLPPTELGWLDDSPQYEVERIVSHRHVRAGKAKEFLVKWKGYEDSDNTWEPASNLANAPDCVNLYKAQHGLL
ncbi:hypothetical protein QJQ45_020105 [Haematococcus lacustris]|nr:hypothetical protein QJQ45_020105 [Haematococcus lacustris]